ncbi:kininogen-1 [Vanacampus margaritifer]
MRSGVGLSLLVLLGLAFSQDDVQPGVHIFCDDPSVERAVTNALHAFNDKLTTGYKLALFQILTATKSESDSESFYSLQFSSRRSDCLAGSPRPYTDCNYHPYGRKVPISCNATVVMTETEINTKEVHCLLDDHIVPETASCLGCPIEIDQNSEDIKVPLSVSISKYNSISNYTHLFSLNQIGHSTRQVVAGFRFELRFDMKKTTCAKAEHNELSDLCVHDNETMEIINCHSTVDVAPWRHVPPQANIECREGPLAQRMHDVPMTTRRLPPGWTPFRSVESPISVYRVLTKEESSEEDATGASPTAANDNNPFHCPSKPWKKFRPAHPVAPPPDGTLPPPTNGPLLDEDLLE